MASRSIPRISDDDRTTYCDDDETKNSHSNKASQQSPHIHHHYCKQFIGIEISPERAEEARSNIRHAQETNQVPSHVSIEIICANALDTDSIDYSRATVIFLYLVPRGLRLIKPIVCPGRRSVRSISMFDTHRSKHRAQSALGDPRRDRASGHRE